MRRFAGRELELSAKLKKKYGEDPALLASDAADAATPGSKVSTATPAAAAGNPRATAKAALYECNFVPFRAPAISNSVLDFRSESFDPLRALQSADVLPGLARTHPLDNLLKCRHLVRRMSRLLAVGG